MPLKMLTQKNSASSNENSGSLSVWCLVPTVEALCLLPGNGGVRKPIF